MTKKQRRVVILKVGDIDNIIERCHKVQRNLKTCDDKGLRRKLKQRLCIYSRYLDQQIAIMKEKNNGHQIGKHLD